MNKAERENMRLACDDEYTGGFVSNRQMTALLDYVNTLEAACKRAADIAVVMSHSAEREIYMILSEALDRGK